MRRVTRRVFLTASAPLWAKSDRPGKAARGSNAGGGGKGTRLQTDLVKFPDPLTERLTWRLTNPATLHHLPHYHNRFLARNNDFLLLASELTGERQIFELRLDDGRLTQLTEGPEIHSYSPSLGPRDRWFLVLQGDTLKQIDVHSLKERKIYTSPSGWRPTGHLTVSDDGRFAALTEMRAADWVDGFEQQFEKHPRCRLRAVESKNGASWVAMEVDHWLAHPQFRPGGTEILYCHEGPWHKVDGRLRLVGLRGENPRNLRPREGGEGLGHEFWGDSGADVYYVFYPDESGRGATVRRSGEPDSKEQVVSRCTSFGWVEGNDDSSVLVGASRSLAGPNIYLLFTQLQRELTICEHASSGKPYPIPGADRQDRCAAWPEPVFSHDSQWVYFTSDKEGKPAIYRMDVSDLVERT